MISDIDRDLSDLICPGCESLQYSLYIGGVRLVRVITFFNVFMLMLRTWYYTRREVHEARWPRTCSRPCAFEGQKNEQKKQNKKNAPPKTHHEIHSRPATATNSRRRAAKHVPRVSPYSPASIDPGFRTALAISKNDECYTHAHTTDKLNNGTLYAPRYEETFFA